MRTCSADEALGDPDIDVVCPFDDTLPCGPHRTFINQRDPVRLLASPVHREAHGRPETVAASRCMVLSGIVIPWQPWGARHRGVRELGVVAATEACVFGGCWLAALRQHLCGGVLSVPVDHQHVLGIEESVFGVSGFTLLWLLGVVSLGRAWRRPEASSG